MTKLKTLLLEDHRMFFLDYKDRIEESFSKKLDLVNTEYTRTFQKMEDLTFIYLVNASIDILILDISLSKKYQDNPNYWSPKLLQNVIKRIESQGKNLLKRKGIAVVFMTAYIEDQYETQMRGNFADLLNLEYLYTASIRKNEFEKDLKLFLEKFKQNFMLTANGNWIMRNLATFYLKELGEIDFLQLTNSDEIVLRQIIALEIDGDGNGTVWYHRNNEVITARFAANINNISNLLNLFYVNNGRDTQVRENFEKIVDTVHFIHISERPFRVVNARKRWIYSGRKSGHGKTLTLYGEQKHREFDCTFDTYNRWFQRNENIFFNRG